MVDAPPFIENNPDVMVEEALDIKPLVNVARPVCVRVELTVRVFAVREPMVAFAENRPVDDAVVAKKAVDVAPPCPIENTVVEALVTASNKLPVPHVVSFEYVVLVPILTSPALDITNPLVPELEPGVAP